jgi:hypothetical protein
MAFACYKEAAVSTARTPHSPFLSKKIKTSGSWLTRIRAATVAGKITNGDLTGTYAINGGCANGDRGNVAGFKTPAFSGRRSSGFEMQRNYTAMIMLLTFPKCLVSIFRKGLPNTFLKK